MKKVERQRVLSLSPLLSREGQEKSSFQVHTHTRARAMVKRKKMRGSIVVARADRIYRCLLEGLRTTGRGKLPFAPAYEAPRSSFRFERILFRSKFIPIRQNFRFSDAIFSFPRETSIIVVSPSSHFTKLSSVVRNVRSNEFRESVDLRATVPAVLRYFSCGAVTC